MLGDLCKGLLEKNDSTGVHTIQNPEEIGLTPILKEEFAQIVSGRERFEFMINPKNFLDSTRYLGKIRAKICRRIDELSGVAEVIARVGGLYGVYSYVFPSDPSINPRVEGAVRLFRRAQGIYVLTFTGCYEFHAVPVQEIAQEEAFFNESTH